MLQCASPEAAFFQELNGINFANLAKGEIDVKGFTAGWMDGWRRGDRQRRRNETPPAEKSLRLSQEVSSRQLEGGQNKVQRCWREAEGG